MAKSRRARRAGRRSQPSAPPASDPATATPQAPVQPRPVDPVQRRVSDFAREYFHVYLELRNIVIVALAMFVVMLGLSYFI